MRGGSSRPGRERATEFEGKTVDDAIRAASHRFRVPPDELDIEVMEEGRVGFLGLGAKEARIRARLKQQNRRGGGGPDDRRGNRTGGGGRDRRSRSSARPVDRGMEQGGGDAPEPFSGAREREREDLGRREDHDGGGPRRRRRGGRGRNRDEMRGDRGDRGDRTDRGDRPPRDDRPSRGPRDSGGSRSDGPRESRPPRFREPREPRDGAAAVHDPALEQEITTFVVGMLDRMGFPGKVSSRFDDGAYCLTVEAGDEDGILIGRKGETLDALQHVAYKMSGRGRDEASTVRIDISGYRERHEEELANEAVEMAKDVLATKRSRQTEPMRAADRRIVHRAISDLGGVTTRAIGTGLVKKILIEIEGASSEGDLAPSPRERAPQRAAGEVLDFVSEPTVDRGGAPVREQVASEWGRKPRPARPGRRR